METIFEWIIEGLANMLNISFSFIFQESNVLIVHLIGALMVFGVGALYAILQTIISYKMYPEYNGLSVCRIRAAISCFSSICFITSILLLSDNHILEEGK